MKRLIHHHKIETDNTAPKTDIYAMSRVGYIPTKGGSLEVYVNTDDPGKLPHFHIRDKDDWSAFHTCVRIDCAEYFKHGSKCDSLSTKEKKELQQFMKSLSRFKLSGTAYSNWEYIKLLWNMNNSDVEVSEDLDQPDYTQL